MAVVEAVTEAQEAGLSLDKACIILEVSERNVRRWCGDVEAGRCRQRSGNPHPHNSLTPEERYRLEAICGSRDLADHSTRALSFHLLEEESVYISHVTIHGYFHDLGVRGSRLKGNVKRGGAGKPDTTFAVEPNDLWCWDITWLRKDVPYEHYYAYVLEDYVSRKIVGWHVSEYYDSEEAVHAWDKGIMSEGLLTEPKACWPTSLSDRGPQMKSHRTKTFFGRNGIAQLFSRPRTPNDNARIESLFATMKTRPDYPERFGSLDEAQAWMARFVEWYNTCHHHSSLDYVTPDQRHRGVHEKVLKQRREIKQACLDRRAQHNRNQIQSAA